MSGPLRSTRLRRALPELLACVVAVGVTAALIAVAASVQPGAPIQVWFLFGAVAAVAAGLLGGPYAALVSGITTILAVDAFGIMPPWQLKLPPSPGDWLAFTVFIIAVVLIVRGARVKRAADHERQTFEAASRRLEDEGRRRQLLLRLAERLLAGGSLDVLYRHATEIVVEGLRVRQCVLLELHDDERTLTVAALAGWDSTIGEGVTIDANVDSQVGYALFAREPVVVHDTDEKPRFSLPTEFTRRGARSGVALRIGTSRPIGVLLALDSEPRAFDDGEVQFLSGVVAVLASAFDRSRLERERTELIARDEIRRDEASVAARRTAFLAQTSTVLDAALEPETTLVSLARLAVPAMADCAVVDLVEEEGIVRRIDVIDIDPMRRQDAEALRRLTPDLRAEGPFPRAIRTGQPVLLPELTKLATQSASDSEHQRLLTRLGCQSLLLIPLVARGQTLGLVTFGSRQPYRYEGADLSLAQELAGRAAMALDNGRLHHEAQAASRAKDEFLAMVSHELRTPLSAVLGWASILRSHRHDETRARQALDAIERSVRSQAQLLEQLLDVSRIVAGKFELRLAPARLNEVIDAAVDSVRPSADEKGIRIDAHLAADLPLMAVDADRLQQVVANLLSNAIKFSPDGGPVEVDLRRADASAEIVVKDNGIGIKREFLPYVFERFRQATGPSATWNRGLGLGLSIVREIVQKHGGSVAAESAGEGKGSTFRVQLPLRAAAEPMPVVSKDRPIPREPVVPMQRPERPH
jgi:signal transduction histidine kinase